MILSIKHKLFITLLLITLLVVTGMYGFMYWSFERGFVRLAEERRQAMVDNIVARLTAEYSRTGSWDGLRQNPSFWRQLLREEMPHVFHAPPPPREVVPHPHQGPPPQFFPPPPHALPETLLALLDTDKAVIVGPEDRAKQLKLYTIRVNNETVGYLGMLQGVMPTDIVAERFKQRLQSAFIVVALVMTVVSAMLALALANTLVKPIQRIAVAAKALAKGQYQIDVPVRSRDELGQLARDVNDLAQALEQTERSRRQWVADISHELRTPLALLQGQLEAIQDGIRPLDRASIDALQNDLLRLKRLVNDLYELSLSDQGTLTYHKEELDPVPLLRSDLEALRDEFAELSIQVEWRCQLTRSVMIHGDPLRLSQLYRNLLNNVLRYTEAGGRLDIGITCEQFRLIITFEDSAPGVAKEELPRLFERFYRVEGSRNRAYGGAGLGLAICRNIIVAHQGDIVAYASPLGGLGVRITLPVVNY